MTIIVDTREQCPWAWPDGYATMKRGTLNAGDYALEGDPHFAIERKSLTDLVNTLFHGWPRFQAELARMTAASFVARIVIVEASDNDIAEHRYQSAVSAQAVQSRIAELRLQGVQVIMAGDATGAAVTAYLLFRRRAGQLSNTALPAWGE